MDKYSPEELEKIIQQYESSQQKEKERTKIPIKKERKTIPKKILCEICRVEIVHSGLKKHKASNRHLLLADIQATSQELKNQLIQVHSTMTDNFLA